MQIKSKIETFGGSDALSVKVADCEGFSVQEYVELPDIPRHADDLISSLKLCFALLDMDEEEIHASLITYGLVS